MFDSVLIANRGEIACRIIRSVKKLGLTSVAVFSQQDSDSPHVFYADKSYLLNSHKGYLSIENIIEVAKKSSAQAIHPGYGFLSENSEFAKECSLAGLVFIGPSTESIELMSNKAKAKEKMKEANIPCIPGYEGKNQSAEFFLEVAEKIQYPLILKAASGGGGKGIRIVNDRKELIDAVPIARKEAINAFGSGELIIEKSLKESRHIEVQICADNFGNIIHLGERECSVQRYNQKVIEESPSATLDYALREQITTTAINVARVINYNNIGTVEFLLDSNDKFYFLEMNTRLQVEHPVTEMVTGVDLVSTQISIAQGKALDLKQSDCKVTGHSIEARVYAEEPENNFYPSTGKINLCLYPSGEGIRVDSGIKEGMEISTFYDSMLLKVIVNDKSRNCARIKMINALGDLSLLGLKTNREYLISVLESDNFSSNMLSIDFLDKIFTYNKKNDFFSEEEYISIASIILFKKKTSDYLNYVSGLSSELLNWSNQGFLNSFFLFEMNKNKYKILVKPQSEDYMVVANEINSLISIIQLTQTKINLNINGKVATLVYFVDEERVIINTKKRYINVKIDTLLSENNEYENLESKVISPIHGKVEKVLVEVGQEVLSGDVLAIVEAMKMLYPINANASGIVNLINFLEGTQVSAGDILFEIK